MKTACHTTSTNSYRKLFRTHYNALLIVGTLRRFLRHKTNTNEITAYIKHEFFGFVEQHMVEEEMILLPQLPPDDSMRMEAEQQHAALYSMAKKCIAQGSISLIEEFVNLLEENIRFAERTLFPYLQKQHELQL